MEEKRVCPMCGVVFKCPEWSHQVYCSKKCRDRKYRRRGIDEYAEAVIKEWASSHCHEDE